MSRLVVGIDGAAPSLNALSWAADVAGVDGVVDIVTAQGMDDEADPFDSGLADMVDKVWSRFDRDQVGAYTTAVAEGSPDEVLPAIAAERHADAVVVGAHVPLLGAPKRLGRTIRRMLEELRSPLIVVPSEIQPTAGRGGAVIVGVGHGEATDAAVRWGANWAAERDVPLGLVRATGETPVFDLDGLLDVLAFYIDPSQRHEWTQEDLYGFAIAAQAVSDREIDISTSAVSGRASTALVDSSMTASLLVIGRHRSRLLRDSHVSQPLRHALTHARCPVAVVPPDLSPISG